MHRLQNYGKEEPSYDGNARSYSSTYHAGTGTLQLYAHHLTAPTTPDGRPDCHMNQLKAYALTSDRDTFVNGVTAFRNLRDSVGDYRKTLISAANTEARRSRQTPADTTVVQEEDDSSPEEYVDCEEHHDHYVERADYATSQGMHGAPVHPHHREDDQDESQSSVPYDAEEPAGSFTTSFTSSFTPGNIHGSRSKRHRNSHSPPSSLQRPKKQQAAQPGHQSGSGKQHHRSKKGQVADSGKGKNKAKAPSPDTGNSDVWEWDDEE